MGQAKLRRQKDPNWGRPRYGLVVSCPIRIGLENSVLIETTELDPQELRANLLFWDQLAWPTNNHLNIEGGADIQFLTKAGVLERPHCQVAGGAMGAILVRAQEQAFSQLEGANPGHWSISQGTNSLFINDGKLTKDQGVAVELISAIPVPDKDVPLDDILEFRSKRYDELRALREEIDNLVSRVNSSAEPELEMRSALAEIDKKCESAIRVCSEWKFPVRISNLKCSFNLKPFAALRDGLAAFTLGVPLGISTAALATVVGANVVSSVEIKGDFGWNGLKDRTNPYRYVSQFHKELF